MSDLERKAAYALEAMRSRNRTDFAERPRPVPKRERPRLDLSDDEADDAQASFDMQPRIARHRGTCRLCHGRIWEGNEHEQGDEIVPLRMGGWAHFFCAEEEAEAA